MGGTFVELSYRESAERLMADRDQKLISISSKFMDDDHSVLPASIVFPIFI
jgi:hypothetical protein